MKKITLKRFAFWLASVSLTISVGFPALRAAADDNIVQMNSEGTSSSDVPATARAESLKEAIDKGCLQVISNLIGDTRMEKYQPIVKSKILGQVGKFVEYYKASEPEKKGTDTVTSVNMKISISSLKDLLTQEGLLNESQGPATILPVIKISESRENGRSYCWWAEEASTQNSFLREQEKALLHHIDGLFRPKNFYLIDPVSSHYVQWMPQPYRNENPAVDDLLWMGDFFKAQMIISGEIVLSPGATPESLQVNFKLTAYQSNNGRVVAEVTRAFEAPTNNDWDLAAGQVLRKGFADVGKDLAGQVMDEWNSGTLGATLLKIGLEGSYGYQDLENFKKQVVAKIGDVKKIRERLMEHGDTVFEVDYDGGLPNLVKVLGATNFDGFHLNVSQVGTDQVQVRWSKGGGK